MQLDMANTGRSAAERHSALHGVPERHAVPGYTDGLDPNGPVGGSHSRLRRPLLIAVPMLVALVASGAYLADRSYASTDNAYVRSSKGSINARVSGQVVEIGVRDNQFVRKGQLLFRIDPEPYRIAVAQAEARLASAMLEVRGLKANYRQQLADLQAARDAAEFDGQEFDRRKNLLASDFISTADYERAEKDFKVSRQHILAAQQQVSSTIAALNGNPGIAANEHPTVREAKAELDKARLNLSYTRIVAPEDGIVTKVDDLQLGDFVNAGGATFAMMSASHIWVEANFRETELTNMRPGEEATIEVDAYPGHPFKAHITSMSPGTGSQFSLLPPENATGNWVKVVQRLPVRLEFDSPDPKRPLYAGISVTVRIDTHQPPLHVTASAGAER